MKGDESKRRLSLDMAVALIALVAALSGTAYAALSSHSVGPRQIKTKAVTVSKFASNSINGTKVANSSLTGKDIDLAKLGTVPSATEAGSARVAGSLDEHTASCPSGTEQIHGLCFDTSPSGPVVGVQAAADACAAKGGYLPTTEQLAGTRGALNLGDGTGVHSEFTDSYFANTESKSEYSTMIVSQNGVEMVQTPEDPETHKLADYEYICDYQLIH